MSEGPNFYSTEHSMSASSSWTATFFPTDQLLFGFPATGLRVYNTCGDRLFYALNGAPSTKHGYVAGCAALVLNPIPPTGSLQLLTTSSSCTSRPKVTVEAWGSA